MVDVAYRCRLFLNLGFSSTLVLIQNSELVDTFFIVIHKKPLIFLHWYHHITGKYCLACNVWLDVVVVSFSHMIPVFTVLFSLAVLLAFVRDNVSSRNFLCRHELFRSCHNVWILLFNGHEVASQVV